MSTRLLLFAMRPLSGIFVKCAIALFAIHASAQTSIHLDFNVDGVLPSAQGFTYVTAGLPGEGTHGASEASVYSVSGGLLHMNTAALGPSMGAAYYQIAGAFDPTKDLLIEFRMQLFADATRDFAILALGPDLTFAGASLEAGLINAYPNIYPAPDPTAFHVYKFFYHAVSQSYDLFIDGTFLGTQQFIFVGAAPNLLYFGDQTGHYGFNGRADIDYITIENPPIECHTSGLSPITDPAALSFEASAPSAPGYSLFTPDISPALDLNMAALQSSMASRLGLLRNRTSGFRPLSYQMHLYELKTTLSALQTAIHTDPSQATACANLLNTLNYEIDVKHDLTRRPPVTGLPVVSPPSLSAHTATPAQAVDLDLNGLTINQLIQVDFLASISGVSRPCRGDTVHFTLPGTTCSQTIRAEVHSPLAILVTDPNGKKIGFAPGSNSAVNEIGPNAFYSGPTSDPQFVDIGSAVPGAYTVTAVGTGAGPYTLTLDRVDEDLSVIEHEQVTGNATPGAAITPAVTVVPLSVNIDIKPDDMSNVINSSSSGTIAVAILSTSQFSAPRELDGNSLRFGATGTEQSLAFCNVNGEDVNGDGLLDLVCHFSTKLTGFSSQITQGVLTGTTKNGLAVEGIDWVDVIK